MSDTQVGSMLVSFNADLTNFRSGIAEVKSSLSGFSSSVADFTSGITSSFSGIEFPAIDTSSIASGLDEVSSAATSTGDALAEMTNTSEEVASGLEDATSGTAGFKDSLDQISSSLQQLGSNIGGVVSGRLNILSTGIQQVASNISDAASGPINNFISRIQSLSSTIGGVASSSFDAFSSRVQDMASTIGGAASNAFDTLSSRVQDMASRVSDAVSGPINSFTDAIAVIGSVVSDAVLGPINAFSDGVQSLASNVSDAASSALDKFASSIQSVSSSVSDAVSGPLNSFKSGVQDMASRVNDAVSGPLNSFSSGVQDMASKVGNAVSGPFNAFSNSIKSFADDISEAASGPLSSLIDGLKSLSSNLNDVTGGALNRFKQGISDVGSGVGNMFQQVFSGEGSLEGLQSGFSGAVSGVQGFIGGIGDAASGVMDFVSNLGAGIMNLQIIGQTAINTASSLLQPAMSAENTQASFTNLLGTTKAATDELGKLNDFAAKTQFKTQDIDNMASSMIAFKTPTQAIIPELTAVGDALTAVGKGTPAEMQSVVDILGKMGIQGKLTQGDITELGAHGINALDLISEGSGKSTSAIQAMIKNGTFPAKDAIDALTKGIEKNPVYSGGMAKQSNTLSGIMSTLSSNWDQALAGFGSPILKAIEPIINNIGNAVASPAFKQFATTVGTDIVNAFNSVENFITSKISPAISGFINYLKAPEFKAFANDIGGLVTALAKLEFNHIKDQLNSFNPAIGIAKDAFKDIAGVVGNVAKGIGDLINWFMKGSEPAKTVGNALTAVSIAISVIKIGQFVASLPALLTGLIAWGTEQWGVAAATLATALPYLIVGAIIAAVVFGIIEAVQHWGDIVKWLTGVWGAVAGFFGWLWGQIAGFFIGAGKWFADRFTEAYKGISSAFGNVGQWFQDRWKDIQKAFGAVGQWFHDLWTGVCNDFNSVLGGLGNFASNIWNGVTGAVKAGFNWVIDLVNNVIRSIDNINIAGFGVSIPLIPHLASGMENFVGGIALVGEKGPELVNLPKGSNVLDHGKTASIFSDISSGMNSNFKYPSAAARSQASVNEAPVVHVHPDIQPHDIYIDGKKLTDALGPHIANAIRLQGGTRVR